MKTKTVLLMLCLLGLSTACSYHQSVSNQQKVVSPVYMPSMLLATNCPDARAWIMQRQRQGLRTTWEQMLSQSLQAEACWHDKYEALLNWEVDTHKGTV